MCVWSVVVCPWSCGSCGGKHDVYDGYFVYINDIFCLNRLKYHPARMAESFRSFFGTQDSAAQQQRTTTPNHKLSSCCGFLCFDEPIVNKRLLTSGNHAFVANPIHCLYSDCFGKRKSHGSAVTIGKNRILSNARRCQEKDYERTSCLWRYLES